MRSTVILRNRARWRSCSSERIVSNGCFLGIQKYCFIQTINKSAWAGAYYRQQRAKGSSHQAAVRALAFKWVRILYRCWQDRVPYDESKYLEALRRRGSPLLKYLVDPA